jgi:hypothetical protein
MKKLRLQSGKTFKEAGKVCFKLGIFLDSGKRLEKRGRGC